jgi:hypothetical protein
MKMWQMFACIAAYAGVRHSSFAPGENMKRAVIFATSRT